MLRRYALLLACSLGFALTGVAAKADPTFVFLRSFEDPRNFESGFNNCINQFKRAGGLAGTILGQLNNAQVVVYYDQGDAGVPNPSPGADSTGKLLHLHWDPNLSGIYEKDKAPKIPCAALLHELQHAARYFTGKECTGPLAYNRAASIYDESMGARAENWWLKRLGKTQRKKYKFFGEFINLGPWTQWPRPAGVTIPAQPKCDRCPDPDASGVASAGAAAPACRRCTRFHQPGCVDFRGGIYSGGDHRRVANGSLRIIIGSTGYCQGRNPCQFKECVTCPHLDTAFPEGVTVTAIATPGKDSKFARWGPGACEGKGQTCSFTARRDSCISAQFLLTNPTAPPQSLRRVPCPEDP